MVWPQPRRTGGSIPITAQRIEHTTTHEAARGARRFVDRVLQGWQLGDLVDDAQQVGSELVTNAMLHTDSEVELLVRSLEDGVRIEVRDASPRMPLPHGDGDRGAEAMTGRGLQLVEAIAARWGAERSGGGKVVWAELSTAAGSEESPMSEERLLALWADEAVVAPLGRRRRVVLREVPVDLLIDARAHTDNLVREFALAAAGAEAGMTTAVPTGLAQLLDTVTTAFADARHAMERQALSAKQRGERMLDVELRLPVEASDAAVRYLEALEAADAHCRAARLLTLETPPRHRSFRRWYVGEIVRQLEAGS